MTADVLAFTGDTTLDIDPDQILAAALGQYPGGVVVIGYNEAGELQFQTSFAEARDLIWALKVAEHQFMAEFVG